MSHCVLLFFIVAAFILVVLLEGLSLMFSRFAPIGITFCLCAAFLLTSGCGRLSSPNSRYDICILVDHSGSARKNQQFNSTLTGISTTYLSMLHTGSTNNVSLRHGGSTSEVAYDGDGDGLKKLRVKLDAMATGKDDGDAAPSADTVGQIRTDNDGCADGLCNGSPIVETLLKPALDWANGRPPDNQKMIVIISDLVADPTKYNDGRKPKLYFDPAKFQWKFDKAQNVHLRLYMVGDATKDILQPAWKSSAADIRFFVPGHEVSRSDINNM